MTNDWEKNQQKDLPQAAQAAGTYNRKDTQQHKLKKATGKAKRKIAGTEDTAMASKNPVHEFRGNVLAKPDQGIQKVSEPPKQ
jgi:hypothetical protein